MDKVCSKCDLLLSYENFSCIKRNEDGSCKYYNSWCNKCRTENNRARLNQQKKNSPEFVTNTHKQCVDCKQMLALDSFHKSPRGIMGRCSYCKGCMSERNKNKPKDRLREYSRRYIEKNRERHLSLHRLRQFKRRNRIAAQSDGTVTDEFLKELYSREYCFWCKRFVERSERSLEHVVELSSGGLHSVSNIEMACISCNSKRLGKHLKGGIND